MQRIFFKKANPEKQHDALEIYAFHPTLDCVIISPVLTLKKREDVLS
ncbi:MAG: hypothetical protein H7839_15420 [Magnetococcus sp. YQC-5]